MIYSLEGKESMLCYNRFLIGNDFNLPINRISAKISEFCRGNRDEKTTDCVHTCLGACRSSRFRVLNEICDFIGGDFLLKLKLIQRHRLPKEQWWLKLRPLNRILAKHETVYVSEVITEETCETCEEETGDEMKENDKDETDARKANDDETKYGQT